MTERRRRQARSRDRADEIVGVAAKLFSQRGYHAVKMEDIGQAIGLDRTSLYFHFANKEAMLAAVCREILDAIQDLYDAVATPDATAQQALSVLIRESLRVGLQQRYYAIATPADFLLLPPDMVRELRSRIDALGRHAVNALREAHPRLSTAEAAFMNTAAIGLAQSLLYHEPRLPRARVVEVLHSMSLAALFLDSSSDRIPHHDVMLDVAGGLSSGGSTTYGRAPSSSRERVLGKAASLFRHNGFEGVGIDAIAKACGVTGNAIYSHFESKDELLDTVLVRASDLIMVAVERALAGAHDAHDALTRLIDGYVDLIIEHEDLLAVYWTQLRAVPHERRLLFIRERRAVIKDWASVIGDVREVTEQEARTMAYAVLSLFNAHWWQANFYLNARHLPPQTAKPLLRSMALGAVLNSVT